MSSKDIVKPVMLVSFPKHTTMETVNSFRADAARIIEGYHIIVTLADKVERMTINTYNVEDMTQWKFDDFVKVMKDVFKDNISSSETVDSKPLFNLPDWLDSFNSALEEAVISGVERQVMYSSLYIPKKYNDKMKLKSFHTHFGELRIIETDHEKCWLVDLGKTGAHMVEPTIHGLLKSHVGVYNEVIKEFVWDGFDKLLEDGTK